MMTYKFKRYYKYQKVEEPGGNFKSGIRKDWAGEFSSGEI